MWHSGGRFARCSLIPPVAYGVDHSQPVGDTQPATTARLRQLVAKRLRGKLTGQPGFRRLWFGQTVSEFGSQVTTLALPLAAVLVLHASTFQVGLLTTNVFAAFLLIGLPAGVWVDWVRRKPPLRGMRDTDPVPAEPGLTPDPATSWQQVDAGRQPGRLAATQHRTGALELEGGLAGDQSLYRRSGMATRLQMG